MRQRGNADAGAAPTHRHSDPLAKFTSHRRYNSAVARDLCKCQSTVDVGRRIANCSSRIGLEIQLVDGQAPEAKLTGGKLCNARLCPFCEWRRTRAWRRRFFEGLPKFHEDFPTHKAIFLTLTVKNCPVNELRTTIQEMHRGWNRMVQRRFFPSKFWFRRTEVTTMREGISQSVVPYMHPHIHCLVLVPSSYFSHGYIKQLEWQKQWMDAMRLDYVPVVDVRRARTKSSSGGATIEQSKAAALEASKYATKATDLINMGSVLGTYHWQMKGLRLHASSTSLRPYIRDASIDSSELVDNETVDAMETVRGKALWFEDIQEYLFSDLL